MYVEKRGLSIHRVARTPGVLPKLSRSLSGQLTSGAAGKVLTILERDLPEVSPFPLWTNCRTVSATLSLAYTKDISRSQGWIDAGRSWFMGPCHMALSIDQLTTWHLTSQSSWRETLISVRAQAIFKSSPDEVRLSWDHLPWIKVTSTDLGP